VLRGVARHYGRERMKAFERRFERLQALMRDENMDLVVIGPGANMLYLTGFSDDAGERPLLFIVLREGLPKFLVPELYARQVEEAAAFPPTHVWTDAQGPEGALRVALRGAEARRVAVDDALAARAVLMLQAALPGASLSLASPLLRELRMRKGPEELVLMERAAAIVDRAFSKLLESAGFRGRTEREVARDLEAIVLEEGAEGMAFETLVASGPNSAHPHHRAGDRRIEPGDVVILDFGCRVGGYCSDITRTVVCGRPTPLMREVHAALLEAQEEGVRAARPGIPAQEVDRAVRGVIVRAGFGERFIHRTGHGIGLEVHEDPYIVEGNPLALEEGMTFSVEPGIYLPGEFGIRVEDIVAVGADGARRLNGCPRDLLRVD